jgi:hypothetical protein
LTLAKTRYLEKNNHFLDLSVTYKDRIEQWREMDRRVRKEGKEVLSVYKHRSSNGLCIFCAHHEYLLTHILLVPSQLAIYKAMLAQDDNFVSTMIPKNSVARFLNDGLKIQNLQ